MRQISRMREAGAALAALEETVTDILTRAQIDEIARRNADDLDWTLSAQYCADIAALLAHADALAVRLAKAEACIEMKRTFAEAAETDRRELTAKLARLRAENAALRKMAEAARAVVVGANDIDPDWRLVRSEGPYEEIVYNSHLHDLAAALDAIAAQDAANG